ncbi:hypothetical protein H312_03451, partial [Anncaliia algerae PRA339]
MIEASLLEASLIRKTPEELIQWMICQKVLTKEKQCLKCVKYYRGIKYKRNKDYFAWRYINSVYLDYKKYVSIRKYTFFDSINISFLEILRILIRYGIRSTRISMLKYFEFSKKTVLKIINKLIGLMKTPNYSMNTLGGPGKIIQIDETMLNFKYKSHRGRSPLNKTNAFCIIEIDEKITRAFAVVISDKKESTIV